MLCARIEKSNAEAARLIFARLSLVDTDKRIEEVGDYVFIPLLRQPSNKEISDIKLPGLEIVAHEPRDRERKRPPYLEILERVSALDIQQELLPAKWELIGDVLLLPLPNSLSAHERELAEAYADVLGARTVAVPVEIVGQIREQRVRIILGEQTETIHKENGIKYKLDTSRLMFSSGNMDERIRMAGIDAEGETVVDMFAGIGYFSLPIAVYCRPAKVIAYELNPVAYRYLVENTFLNHVNTILKAQNMDNRNAAEDVADRVVMGYLKDTDQYLDKAISILKDHKGIIHYHENCPNELIPQRPEAAIKSAARERDRDVAILQVRHVKSYAPGVSHIVLDARIY